MDLTISPCVSTAGRLVFLVGHRCDPTASAGGARIVGHNAQVTQMTASTPSTSDSGRRTGSAVSSKNVSGVTVGVPTFDFLRNPVDVDSI